MSTPPVTRTVRPGSLPPGEHGHHHRPRALARGRATRRRAAALDVRESGAGCRDVGSAAHAWHAEEPDRADHDMLIGAYADVVRAGASYHRRRQAHQSGGCMSAGRSSGGIGFSLQPGGHHREAEALMGVSAMRTVVGVLARRRGQGRPRRDRRRADRRARRPWRDRARSALAHAPQAVGLAVSRGARSCRA